MLNTSIIPYLIELGKEHKDWYKQTREFIYTEFPYDDFNIIIDMLAATSQRSSISSNVTQFFKAYYQFKNGLPFEGFLTTVKNNLTNAISRQPLNGRKIHSFSRAMKGDLNAVVVDIWICRALDVDRKYIRTGYSNPISGGASDLIYTQCENFFRREAVRYNLYPAEMSAMVWAGIRKKENNRYIPQTYNTFIDKRLKQLSLKF